MYVGNLLVQPAEKIIVIRFWTDLLFAHPPAKMKQLVKESIETNLKEEKRLDVRPEFDV